MGIGIVKRTALLLFAVSLCVLCLKTNAMANETGENVTLIETSSELIDIDDEEVPMGVLPKHAGISWWWITIIIVVGAVGAELLSRYEIRSNKKKKTFESLSDIATRPF